MASGEGYDEQLAELAKGGAPIDSTYWALVLDDIRHAADVLRPTYDTLHGHDGFVSVEVAPTAPTRPPPRSSRSTGCTARLPARTSS